MYAGIITLLVLLFGGINFANGQEAPSSGRQLLGLEMPFEWPDLPQLPELPPLPENLSATDALDTFVKQVAIALPSLKTLGYEIYVFDVAMFPPSAKLRIESRLAEGAIIGKVELGPEANYLSTTLVEYAKKAKSIQQLLKLERLAIDVRLDVSPKMKMSFSDAPEMQKSESCGDEL